jgi:CRP-like cAMP-binding protein
MDDYHKFIEQFFVKKAKPGNIILAQGEVPPYVYVVKKGTIKAYNLTNDGDEKPITFEVKGGVFPLGWAFDITRFSQYYYEAFEASQIYCVPKEEYKHFLMQNPKAMHETYQDLVRHHLNYQMRINALEQSRAIDKIANTLHYLAINFGIRISKNDIKVQLPLTHQDLANYMGITRETTGLELKKLQKQGVVSYSRRHYIIHRDKLSEVLDDEYGLGFIITH